MWNIIRNASPLAKRIVIYIVLASTIITVFTSLFQLYGIYKSKVNTIESRLQAVRDSNSSIIASRLWVLNTVDLNNLLKGILQLPDIEYVDVYEEDKLLTSQGELSKSDSIKLSFPLYHSFRNKRINIGEVNISASLSRTYEHLVDQAVAIVISNGIKTFLISGFMLFLFYNLVARHLITLGNFSEKIDIDSLDNELILDKKTNSSKDDELDKLASTLVALQFRLKQSIKKIELQEEIVRRTQKMDALGKLTGGIAHDYNNMMGIVLGYSELLLSQVADNEDAIEYVVYIQTAAERARDLTNKLMSFSRDKTSSKTVTSLNKELEKEKHLLDKTLTSRIKLTIDSEDDLWPVHLDSGDFNDAIINMTINASHAIEGTGTVNIFINNVHLNNQQSEGFGLTEGDYVKVLFSDSGKGMDSETASKIFDPFFSTKGEQGTGLGLSQVYGFMTRSGGAIKVKSELNIGTEFVLYFPRYDGSNLEQEIIESIDKNTFKVTDETILVVDDEKALCNLAKEILENQGYHVLLAFSGAQALEILKTERVDIVFSDVIMPEMTGYELGIKISNKYPDIIIQLTSGFDRGEKLKPLNNSSTFDVLNKPYTRTELLNKLTTLLNKR